MDFTVDIERPAGPSSNPTAIRSASMFSLDFLVAYPQDKPRVVALVAAITQSLCQITHFFILLFMRMC